MEIASTTRVMVSNFDSVTQSDTWSSLMNTVPTEYQLMKSDMWWRDNTGAVCMQLLNRYGIFASHFAGIIRTAYLYSNTIVLPINQILDGVFFLALGPDAIRQIMGQTYKDTPSLIVSGMGEDCLASIAWFFLCKIHVSNGKRHIIKSRVTHIGSAEEEGDDIYYAIRPLTYSALDTTITEEQVLALPLEYLQHFTQQVRSYRNAIDALPQIVGDGLAYLNGNRDERVHQSYAFLTQRLTQWVEAEYQGMIRYENQLSESFKQRVKEIHEYIAEKRKAAGESGEEDEKTPCQYFEYIAQSYTGSLKDTVAMQSQAASAKQQQILDAITTQMDSLQHEMNRTAAFAAIDSWKTEHPEIANTHLSLANKTGQGSGPSAAELLHDWYQAVYMRVFAWRLGSQLVAVSMQANSFETITAKKMQEQHHALVLDGDITENLGAMPYTLFSTFTYEYREPIAAWRACTGETSLQEQRARTRSVAYAVRGMTEAKSYESDRHDILRTFAIMVLAAVISVIVDNILPLQSMAFAVLFIILLVVQLIPDLIDLIQFAFVSHSSTTTVVHIDA